MRPDVALISASTAATSRTRSGFFRGFTQSARDTRKTYGEQRFLTLGLLEDQGFSLAHTERGNDIRIISIRKAAKHEARFHFSQIVD